MADATSQVQTQLQFGHHSPALMLLVQTLLQAPLPNSLAVLLVMVPRA